MLVVLQLVVEAGQPPNVIELVPWGKPKFCPVTEMMDPIGPKFGDRPVMLGVVELTVCVNVLDTLVLSFVSPP
jgi:hypothetical protein